MKAGSKKRVSAIAAKAVALLLVCFMVLLDSAVYAYAAQEETKLTLKRKNDSENVHFSVENMLPGDEKTHVYRIAVTGKSIEEVWFLIDVKNGSEKLAEVLKCQVVLKDSGTVLYDGLMSGLAEGLPCPVDTAEAGNAELVYEITAYLDTKIGNDYQGKKLEADFVWWTQEVRQRIETSALTEVPEGLKNTAFNTVEKIKEELGRVLITKCGSGYSIENMEFYDVRLQFWNGKVWIDATAENFPLEGIEVVLPYPEGTSKDTHDFRITHMFTVTSKRLGIVAGEVEYPPVTKREEGLHVTFMGLSPVAIAWKELDTEGQRPADSTEDISSETQIMAADTVTIDPDTGDTTPIAGYICLMLSAFVCVLCTSGIVRRHKGDRDE